MRIGLVVFLVGLTAAKASAVMVQVIAGDCLWSLAEKHYKNPHHWRRIFEANAHLIKDPHWIYPGQTINIPEFAEEASAPIAAPAPTEASAPIANINPDGDGHKAAAAAKRPEPDLAPAAPEEPRSAPTVLNEDLRENAESTGLNEEMPPAMNTYNLGFKRFKAPKNFRPDGSIIESIEDEGMEPTISVGHKITVKLEPGVPVSTGELFTVYRQLGVLEDDADKKGIYMHAVAQIEALPEARHRKRRFRVLSAGDTLVIGDWIKRGGEIK